MNSTTRMVATEELEALSPDGAAGLGAGLGAAIAARLARPSAQVVLLLGDEIGRAHV